MLDSETKNLLASISVIQQDMHELKYKYMRITSDNNIKFDKQLRDIQVRLMILEAILKKHFGSDFIDDCDIIEKSGIM